MARAYSRVNQYYPNHRQLKTEKEIEEIENEIDLARLGTEQKRFIKRALREGDTIVMDTESILVKQGGSTSYDFQFIPFVDKEW